MEIPAVRSLASDEFGREGLLRKMNTPSALAARQHCFNHLGGRCGVYCLIHMRQISDVDATFVQVLKDAMALVCPSSVKAPLASSTITE